MAGRDDAAVSQKESRIYLVHYFRLGYRVDLIQANDFRVTSQTHFIPAANDVQMTDARVVMDRQLLNASDHVEMTDVHVVREQTLARVDNAQPNAHSLADFVTKEPTIKAALEERRQEREDRDRKSTRLNSSHVS